MRSSSPDLKVFWPQQQAAQAAQAAAQGQVSKSDVYQAYQQQMHQIQQLKMQQQQLLQQKAFNQQQQQQPVGAKPTRFVSQQSIQISSKQKVGKYVPPGKAKQMQQNKNQTTNNTSGSNNQEKQKQGPYNKVLIVGLSAEYRSLNGVLNIFRPYGDVVSARVYRPYSTLPNEITRWCPSVEVQDSFSAVVEYPTARCAKFAVGVLRERVQSNRYRVVLLKPGAYEELQRQKLSILALSQTKDEKTKVTETQSDSGNESFEVTSRVSSSDIASD